MKRMLINATQPEETRVALVDGQKLYDLDIESTNRNQKKSNIYKGRIAHIEQSLEAAFVDYGGNRHGFLPFKEISLNVLKNKIRSDQHQRASVKDLLKENQEIIVQIEKEERNNKGAALTTMTSLAGRYIVLMPNNLRSDNGSRCGISRQIEGANRTEALEIMKHLDVPKDATIILRTAGIGKSKDELQWDINYLTSLWNAIDTAANERSAPFLIYQESEVIIRAIRDYLRKDIEEIWVDNKDIHQRSLEFMEKVMPHNLHKLKFYEGDDPLFTKYQIENQIESAFSREIRLPSGGSLSIDHTEALASIDINSARATKGADIEETAFNTNLEAAEEITRQLRLRDLGGLIVIDFIDMSNSKHQREVENRIKSCARIDRARIQIGEISRFGLLEMSRQRLRPSLGESRHLLCPRCNGQGSIRDVESISLAILRIIEEEAMKDSTSKVIANLPVSAATFLLNEKRQTINELHRRLDVQIVIIPCPDMKTPHYNVQRVHLSESNNAQYNQLSYQLADKLENDYQYSEIPAHNSVIIEQPAVKQIIPQKPVNTKKPICTAKFVSGIINFLSNILGKTNRETQKRTRRPRKNSAHKSRRGHHRSTANYSNNYNKNPHKARSGHYTGGSGGGSSNRSRRNGRKHMAAKQHKQDFYNKKKSNSDNDSAQIINSLVSQSKTHKDSTSGKGMNWRSTGKTDNRTDVVLSTSESAAYSKRNTGPVNIKEPDTASFSDNNGLPSMPNDKNKNKD